MYPNNRSNPQAAAQTSVPDKHITIYVLLAGVAGGLMLAVVVMVCCKVCLRKKKPLTRQHVVFSRSSERQHSRARKYHSLDSTVSVDIETSCGFSDSSPSPREAKEFITDETKHPSTPPQTWARMTVPDSLPNMPATKTEDSSRKVAPDQFAEVTIVRRRSSVGIQRQASVCLSDGEDQDTLGEPPGDPGGGSSSNRSSDDSAKEGVTNLSSGSSLEKSATPSKRSRAEVTQVSAVVHQSSDLASGHSCDGFSICSTISMLAKLGRPPVYARSYSSPDSGSTATVLEIKTDRPSSAGSLKAIMRHEHFGTVARVIDLEEYHYSQRQVWALASRGASLLQERSQSSLDVAAATEGWLEVPVHLTQAGSTEAGLLEQSLELHQKENLRALLRRRSPVDEEDEMPISKVRYNDTGSREEIRDEVDITSGDTEEDEEEHNILDNRENDLLRQQYRKLWELRATLEEEEDELSDTLAAEEDQDGGDDDDYGDVERALRLELEPPASQTTSFESNADVTTCDDGVDCPGDSDCSAAEFLQLPSQESRRHSYKNLLTKRLQRLTPDNRAGSGSTENSFDSMESSSTDRTDCVTTSFESTTDNTDSTGEGQTHRLQQMKADSGYKSMESNGKPPRLSRRQLQFTVEGDSLDCMMTTLEGSLEEEDEEEDIEKIKKKEFEITSLASTTIVTSKTKAKMKKETKIDTKIEQKAIKKADDEGLGAEEHLTEVELTESTKTKSALKRRHTEKHSVGDSMQWIELRTMSEDYPESRGKTSVFKRFFRSSRTRYDRPLTRDYSIDEKSDALFREFSRSDLAYDTDYCRSRVSRHYGHIRLHHHHHHHHHRRSYDQEGGSPRLSCKVLSPQLSIEEEESCDSGDEQKSAAESARSSHGVGEHSRGALISDFKENTAAQDVEDE